MIGIQRKPHYYDGQIKRLLVDLMSVFTGYQVQTGVLRDGKRQMRDVPIIYGDMSRVAGYAIGPRGDQDNQVNYLPLIAVYLTGLVQSNEHRRAPQHVETHRYKEAITDSDGNVLLGAGERLKEAKRWMPVPYEATISVSIWASNNDEGLQLLEQIISRFNPETELNIRDTVADWSYYTKLVFDGSVNFEKATPSAGDTDPLYISQMNFNTILYINKGIDIGEGPVIETIHVPINDIDNTPLDGFVIRNTDVKINE